MDLLSKYKLLLEDRILAETLERLYKLGKLQKGLYMGKGEEAIPIGVSLGLNDEDVIIPHFRGMHKYYIMRGTPISEIIEDYTGRTRAKSLFILPIDLSENIFGLSSACLGPQFDTAVGISLAFKLQKSKRIVLLVFGDGESNRGNFHEALTFASMLKLPIVFLCQNNQWAQSMPASKGVPVANISDRAIGYGIRGITIDGNDIDIIENTVRKMAERARNGSGPSLIEAKTYRLSPHSGNDEDDYRPPGEYEKMKKLEPLVRLENKLLESGIAKKKNLKETRVEIKRKIDKAVDSAFKKKKMFSVQETLNTQMEVSKKVNANINFNPNDKPSAVSTSKREITFREALTEALREEMHRDKKIYLIGEDIGVYHCGGGPFRVTQGLLKEFGDERVISTPIVEGTIIGSSVGAAIFGMRPIAEIMHPEFLSVCFHQIVYEATRFAWFGEDIKIPMVIRVPFGTYEPGVFGHVESPESWFCHVPNLKVIIPSTPSDAKGLLKAAIRDDFPVLFFEHRALYDITGKVPENDYLLPFNASIKRKGKDVTVITYGKMVHEVLAASKTLMKKGIDCEIIDLRVLKPLDIRTVITSVAKTGKAVIVHEARKTGGFGAEIAALLSQKAFNHLHCQIERICSPDLISLFPPTESSISNIITTFVKK